MKDFYECLYLKLRYLKVIHSIYLQLYSMNKICLTYEKQLLIYLEY